MNAFSSRDVSHPIEPANLNANRTHEPGAGVRGWLLALCLMLTIVGPVICVWLMVEEYANFAPYLAASSGRQIALVASLLATTGSTLFGIYAGLRLWRVQANAVNTAKMALLVGLAADIFTTTIDVVAGPTSRADGNAVHPTLFHLAPSLIFFTLCFAYLQHSNRVDLTYGPSKADA